MSQILLPGQRYEFTITLRPRLYDRTPEEQFRYTSDILQRECLSRWNTSCVAELTKENNIHYHGIVHLKDFKHRNSFLNGFRKYNNIFGRKSCSPIRKESDWIMYMRKNVEETRQILGQDPWVTDVYELGGSLNWKLTKFGHIFIDDGIGRKNTSEGEENRI